MKPALLLLVATAGLLRPGEIPHTTEPKVIHSVQPEYTKEARDAKLQGTVVLSALIGVDGVPADIKVVQGLRKGLDEKAVECFKKWRFKPGSNYFGEPSPTKVTIEMNFRLAAI
ncbi:MAG: energy transducer TonB [Bryobacteraceae bacterium]|jgi:TonB family protein